MSTTARAAVTQNVESVLDRRADFPILKREVNSRPLVYLDNAATTQKPQVVIDAVRNYYETYNSNIHRGIHTLSMRRCMLATAAKSDQATVKNREFA